MNTKHHKPTSIAAVAAFLLALPLAGSAEDQKQTSGDTPIPSPGYWLPKFWDRSNASQIWHDPNFVPQKESREAASRVAKQIPARNAARYGAGAPVVKD
ncbi:MAG TPA: hypothetical protein P5016_13755 [Verrucomicrobiales bacterium]|nr:hypothetical protein [Verrucomicrobiales bacterium]